MEKEFFNIANVPAVVYGEKSDSCYFYVHGMGGNKSEAERFALIAAPRGYQVIAVDLPEHGGRTDGAEFVPWNVAEEFRVVMDYVKSRWNKVSIRATSIGVYFSLSALKSENIEKCLFVSPLVDMQRMIADLMRLANVTEEELKIRKEIKTDFGQTLSWRYLCYARENAVKAICRNTAILYASGDELIPRETVENFAQKNGCELTVLNGGEHWLHLPSDVEKMELWEKERI